MSVSTHRHGLCWVAFFIATASSGSAAEKADAWIRGHFAGRSPQPVAVAPGEAWLRAGAVAAQVSGAFMLLGTGDSMEPLYPSGTVLVCVPRDYRELQRGETVLFRNRDQRLVAHLLTSRVRDGWRVRGLNNRWQDMEPVLESNLAGVVIAAFAPLAAPAPRSAARGASAFFATPVE